MAEDRYSQVFKLDRVRPAVVADGLAELQVRRPDAPIIFGETRQLAEEWTYRLLAAAHAWAQTRPRPRPRSATGPAAGLAVSDRGRLRPEVWAAWRDAQ